MVVVVLLCEYYDHDDLGYLVEFANRVLDMKKLIFHRLRSRVVH